MILCVGVKVLLKNKEGKYLLLKRAPSRFKGINGTWDIVGGRIKTGTKLVTNLKREVREETGLHVLSKPTLISAQDIFWHENDTHVVRLTYCAETSGEPVLNEDEHVDWRWLTIDQIKNQPNLDIYLSEVLQKHSLI
jgi:8-oxo-dGTP pyrophosphatase MutT (NUDIX family)